MSKHSVPDDSASSPEMPKNDVKVELAPITSREFERSPDDDDVIV